MADENQQQQANFNDSKFLKPPKLIFLNPKFSKQLRSLQPADQFETCHLHAHPNNLLCWYSTQLNVCLYLLMFKIQN